MNTRYRGTILVVDDDPFVLESISLLLRGFGFTAIPSSSPHEALERLRQERVEVVLTDFSMPGISGLELLEQVHAMDENIPVILITAYAEREVAIEALNKGVFAFIEKPYKAELLTHSIEKAVRYHRLIQTEKEYKGNLESLNYELETMVAERTMSLMALTVADKVRNPSAVIAWTCKRILEKETLTEGLRSDITDIMEEARKLEGIVKDFELILKGKQSMFEYWDLNEIVTGVIPIIEGDVAYKKLDLEVDTPETPLRINAQKNLLRIAFIHLIRNAIEATPEGGKISITAYGEKDQVFLAISNTGTFIPEVDQDRIFDPFFTTKARRFGMGLAMVKQIISEHFGDICVKSREGEGTVFTIVLPVRWSEAAKLS
ncbi:MAG: hybrid sensor histidine kinase/response regulator [Nitrospirales bacterium]|nr:hybrid sensor histidine kinase/response regulator [Nitrospirales bacterium]